MAIKVTVEKPKKPWWMRKKKYNKLCEKEKKEAEAIANRPPMTQKEISEAIRTLGTRNERFLEFEKKYAHEPRKLKKKLLYMHMATFCCYFGAYLVTNLALKGGNLLARAISITLLLTFILLHFKFYNQLEQLHFEWTNLLREKFIREL